MKKNFGLMFGALAVAIVSAPLFAQASTVAVQAPRTTVSTPAVATTIAAPAVATTITKPATTSQPAVATTITKPVVPRRLRSPGRHDNRTGNRPDRSGHDHRVAGGHHDNRAGGDRPAGRPAGRAPCATGAADCTRPGRSSAGGRSGSARATGARRCDDTAGSA